MRHLEAIGIEACSKYLGRSPSTGAESEAPLPAVPVGNWIVASFVLGVASGLFVHVLTGKIHSK